MQTREEPPSVEDCVNIIKKLLGGQKASNVFLSMRRDHNNDLREGRRGRSVATYNDRIVALATTLTKKS